ncbi:hypothetical protein IWX90DRAFT_28737 [Phyllosticta citrichinensis]|uniref:Uncharacterized protein n=1 Tax=Phyllosticta citrichinensis TaxID=1130410 RepID=A0ABR1Y7I4_9PEZI
MIAGILGSKGSSLRMDTMVVLLILNFTSRCSPGRHETKLSFSSVSVDDKPDSACTVINFGCGISIWGKVGSQGLRQVGTTNQEVQSSDNHQHNRNTRPAPSANSCLLHLGALRLMSSSKTRLTQETGLSGPVPWTRPGWARPRHCSAGAPRSSMGRDLALRHRDRRNLCPFVPPGISSVLSKPSQTMATTGCGMLFPAVVFLDATAMYSILICGA